MVRIISRLAITLILFVSNILAMAFAAESLELLKITNIWARPANAGANSAAYMKIENMSSEPVNIIAASAWLVANNTELHDSFLDNNITKMRIVDNIIIPARSIKEFAPGGLHVMLIDLMRDLKLGDIIEIAIVTKQTKEPVIIKAVIANGPDQL